MTSACCHPFQALLVPINVFMANVSAIKRTFALDVWAV
jgi:hypothetical protein